MADEKCGFCEEHSLRALKIDQNCKEIAKVSGKVERMDDEIHGGGSKDGILTQLALMQRDISSIKTMVQESVKKQDIVWLNRLVWGTTSTVVFWVLKEVLVGRFSQ